MSETTSPRPFTAAAFQQYLAEEKLMAARCARCGALHLPPRAICPSCRGDALEWTPLSGRGTLAAFTVIYVAPTFMLQQGFSRENPYVSGVVRLEEGVQISARITGVDPAHPETIRIGQPLQVEFIPVGEGDARRVYLGFCAL